MMYYYQCRFEKEDTKGGRKGKTDMVFPENFKAWLCGVRW